MNLLFYFSDNTTQTSSFILNGAKITECFYNNLKSADNSAQVTIPFNETLCDKLKAEISKNIKVQIKNGDANIFTGYVRKTLSFAKTQRNQPFALEIVSPSLILDTVYKGNSIHYSNTSLGSIVSSLLSLSPFSGQYDIHLIDAKDVLFFKLEDGENIKEVLSTLLYEYGFCFDFDADGNFYITQLFTSIPSTITQKFNGDNCLNTIAQNVKENKYDSVTIKYKPVEEKRDVVIFEDTTGGNATDKANIPIPASSYYLGAEKNILNYDSKYQAIGWITSASIDISFDNNSDITYTFKNLGNAGELSVYNGGTSGRTIKGLTVIGSGFFELSDNSVSVGQQGTESVIQTKYILNEQDALYLARKISNYYQYSNFNTQVQSKTKYDLGTYVELSDRGIGTVIYRIVKRVWDIALNQYIYSLESVTDYTPIETYTTSQNVNSKPDNGESLRDAVSDLAERVDAINVETTMVNADILNAIIRLDNDGKVITNQTITTTITVKQSDVDLPFSIGTLNLPDGWSYEILGRQIKFTISEGASIRSGQFAIPVLYSTIAEQDNYVDENDEQYIDENGASYIEQKISTSYSQTNLYFTYFGDNGGYYLGIITRLEDIPTTANYGDFFTWGANDTASAISMDGEFLRARVYMYIGEKQSYKWREDSNSGHSQIALSDVLSVANEDLEHNNSTAYEFLDHLTSNTIYSDMIVSNQAFIDKITTKIISIGNLVTVGVMDDAIAQSEINVLRNAEIKAREISDIAMEIASDDATQKSNQAKIDAIANVLAETGIDTLTDHTIIQNGYIKTGLIDADILLANVIRTNDITSGDGKFTGLKAENAEFTNANVTGFLSAKGFDFVLESGDIEQFTINHNIMGGIGYNSGQYIVIPFSGKLKYKMEMFDNSTSGYAETVYNFYINGNIEKSISYPKSITKHTYESEVTVNAGDELKCVMTNGGGRVSIADFKITFYANSENYFLNMINKSMIVTIN
ncbi:MAG: hypothetical protein MJZ03_03360 [archaeon]|nr:hypothetical protein [archaeon]